MVIGVQSNLLTLLLYFFSWTNEPRIQKYKSTVVNMNKILDVKSRKSLSHRYL